MGGMGVVYRALDHLTGQHIALKQVTHAVEQEHATASKVVNLRLALAQEFKVLASLRHPNIISVLDYGFDEERLPYFTMDLLVEPVTILQAADDFPIAFQVGLLIQTLQALAYLHRWRILHRDLKPENVLVMDKQVKVLDFGLAQHRDQATADDVTGTLVYIAPEVLQGNPASEASDLYSVGVMAYELFAGRYLFDVKNVTSLIQEILTTPPDMDALMIEPALQAVIARLLAKDPAERYASALEVIQALSQAIGQAVPTETAAIRESFLQAARFTGRENELAQLEDALAAIMKDKPSTEASSHTGSTWLVSGESGVGKSRLLEELRTLALVRGAHVIRGQSVSEGGGLYSLWREVLRRFLLIVDVTNDEASVLKIIVPDISDILGREVPDALVIEPVLAQARLQGVMSAMMRRLDKPVVIILEDLHWAGTENLAILRQINQVVHELPLLIVSSFRDEEAPDLAQRFANAQHIHLLRLTSAEIRDLSVSILGVWAQQPHIIQLLEHETEGNVFFLVEVVRALAEEAGELNRISTMTLPKSVFAGGVKRAVERRLLRVPARWRDMLDVAAVIGRQLDLNILRLLFPDTDWQTLLTDCASVVVLEVQDDRWRFAHDKLREGLLSGLLPDQRRNLHRQAALAIEQIYAGDPDQLSALAYHWDYAGDIVRGADYAGQAGQLELDVSAYEEALSLFNQALRPLSDPLDNEKKRRKALFKRLSASTQWGLSRYIEAGELYAESLTLYTELNDEAGMSEALKGLGDVARRKGEYVQARTYFSRCLELCERTNNQLTTAQALARLGLTARIQGDYPLAEGYYRRSLTIFSALNEHERIASLQSGLGLIASDQGRLEEAKAYMEQSLVIARRVHNPSGTALMLTGLAWVNYLRGAFTDAREQSLESLSLSRDIGDRWSMANNLGNLGKISAGMQNFDQAYDHFKEALSISRHLSAVPLTLEILPGVAQLFCQQGQYKQAISLLRVSLEHPACYSEVLAQAQPLLNQIREQLPSADFEPLYAQAADCTLDEALDMIFNQQGT